MLPARRARARDPRTASTNGHARRRPPGPWPVRGGAPSGPVRDAAPTATPRPAGSEGGVTAGQRRSARTAIPGARRTANRARRPPGPRAAGTMRHAISRTRFSARRPVKICIPAQYPEYVRVHRSIEHPRSSCTCNRTHGAAVGCPEPTLPPRDGSGYGSWYGRVATRRRYGTPRNSYRTTRRAWTRADRCGLRRLRCPVGPPACVIDWGLPPPQQGRGNSLISEANCECAARRAPGPRAGGPGGGAWRRVPNWRVASCRTGLRRTQPGGGQASGSSHGSALLRAPPLAGGAPPSSSLPGGASR